VPLALFGSVAVTMAFTWVWTAQLQQFGAGLVLGVPWVQGFCIGVILDASGHRTFAQDAAVLGLALAVDCAGIVVLGIDGIVCMLMATPLWLGVALLGLVTGRSVARVSVLETAARLLPLVLLALPAVALLERQGMPPPRLRAVTTSAVVDAPPARVWRNVVSFRELPPQTELLFRLGIAYPVRARIDGEGAGAVRHCDFDTGAFVEPITAWEPPRRLAFDVASSPQPMREWNPLHPDIHPTHLDGSFRSERGEFRLELLPDGRTRLLGTTWYRQTLWPESYWAAWSDMLLHSIHQRVLRHIAALSERRCSRARACNALQ
jgi:Polyketide cyclase / dehydrase and lipid transport